MRNLRIRIDGGNDIEINKSRFSIGSSKDNDLVIPGISPKHLIIYNIEGKWLMIAADTVKLNDRDFRGEAEIRDGDVVEVGGHVIEFVMRSKNEGYFRVLSGKDAGKLIPVEKEGIVGRSPFVEYRLNDPYVSRRHAKIYVEDGSYYIEDLNPKNPILLNNKVLHGKTALHSGDEIRMGKTRLLFINPSEKEETALYRRSKKPLYFFTALILLVILGISTFWFLGRRESMYYRHVSIAKVYASKAANAEDVVDKVKYLDMSLRELEEASRYGDVGNLDDFIKARLESWREVMRAAELVSKGEIDSARKILRRVEPIVGNSEVFTQIYSRVQRLGVATQALVAAETLEKKGKKEEAKKLRQLAMKYIPKKGGRKSVGNTESLPPVPEPKKEEGKINLEESLLKEASIVDIMPEGSQENEISTLQMDEDIVPFDENLSINANMKEEEGSKIQLTSMSILELRQLYESGDLEKLVRKAKEYLRQNPDDAAAEYYLNVAKKELRARELSKKGRVKEAMKAWSEVLLLDPYNERAKKAIIELGSR